MTEALATHRMMAAFIVENADSFPGPRFLIATDRTGSNATLHIVMQDDARTLCSSRDPSQPKRFATIEAALRAAQGISTTAGHEADHAWTGQAERLPPMPAIGLHIDLR